MALIETPAQQLAVLQRRYAELRKPPRPTNPWQADYCKFAIDWIWTKDEERAGQVAKLPSYSEDWRQYWREFSDALIERDLLMIEKSRRVMASWFVCGFDLWLAAGGQDPRWPSLMRSTHNRSVTLTARKLKGKNGSHWFLHHRIKFIYQQAMLHGIKDAWPEFPQFDFIYDEGKGSNGALISAIPEGEDQARGGGETFIHNEEFASWPRAQATLAVQIPCIKNGGHICIVTTPQVDSHASKIRNGELALL